MSRHVSKPINTTSTSRRSTILKRQNDSEEEDVAGSDDDGLKIESSTNGRPRERHEDGTIIEAIPLGPVDHPPIDGDPDFETIEPNSRIRLKYVSPLSLCLSLP